jgi:two-component system, NarL family, response regulator DevR
MDSHEIFRAGVRSVLDGRRDLSVVGEAHEFEQALDLVGSSHPHVVVVGIREHERGLLDQLPRLRTQHPASRVLVLTRPYDDPHLMAAALRAGASGALGKDVEGDRLVDAVDSIARGHHLVRSDALRLADRSREAEPTPAEGQVLARLTPQERKILALISQGMTNRQIGEELFLVEKTVRNHVTRLLAKLGVERRTQAALLAARHLGEHRNG